MGGCATKPKVLKGDEGQVQAPVPPPEPSKEPVPAVLEAKEVAHVVANEAEGEKKVEHDQADVVKAKDVDEAPPAMEVVNDDNVDNDQANKSRSLSNLFKEKEKNGASESVETTSEPTKNESLEPVKQEPPQTVKQELLGTVKQESPEPVKPEAVEPLQTEPVESVQIKAVEPVKAELSEPEKQAPSDTEKLTTVNQVSEEPSKPIEQTDNPMPVSVAPENIESAQSIEAKPAPEAAVAAVAVPETQNKETSAEGKEGQTEVAK